MNIYNVKVAKIVGTSYKEIHKNALVFYARIISQTKRKPYIRSAYFNKEKIFLDLFWSHLYQKENEKMKNPNKSSEILHRFLGITAGHEKFTVQIKESIGSKRKFFISVFPTTS